MDLKLPVTCDASNVATFVETNPCTAIKNPLRTTCRILGVNGKTDALEAVKLDPAVLEAQVTVDAKTIANDSKEQNVADKEKEAVPSSSSKAFEDMVSQHEAALLSLTPAQLEMLMKYADILRRQRMATRKYKECVFCKNNGKSLYWYTSHTLKDNRGRVQCPVLRSFRCPQCGATGDYAHTIKYCPQLVDTDARNSAF